MLGLGGSSQLGIGIAVRLHDQFSGRAAQINQQLLAMRKNSNQALVGAMNSYRNQAAMIAYGGATMVRGMVAMAESGAEFQHRINQVAIVGGKELKRSRADLVAYANEMSRTFTRTPTEVAGALFENVKAGVTKNLEEITKYQVAVATATDEQLAGPSGVAEKLLGIMSAYDLSMDKFKDISNATTYVANATISNVNDIGEAMQYAAFTAKNFNIPLEMTLSMIGKLSQSKIFGSSAGTAINNMLLQLAKTLGPLATKKSHKAWAMLGLDENMMRGMANQGDMKGVIGAISTATKDMTPINRNALISDIFNRRGDRGIEGLFDSKHGNVDISKLYAGAVKAEKDDLVMKQSKAMMNDFYSDMKFLTNAFHRFKNAFSTALAPTLGVMFRILGKVLGVLEKILNTPVGKVLAGIAAVGITVTTVLFAFRAAALTAALALRTIGISSSVGGFAGLMRGGMGAAGIGMMGAAGGTFTRNALGRMTVTAGQTVNWGGKLYKGGQILPQAYAASMGTNALRGGGGLLTGLRGVGAMAGRWLPVIGWVFTISQILKMMYDDNHKDDEEKAIADPMIMEYYRSLDTLTQGNPEHNAFYNKWGMSRKDRDKQMLNQNIIINLDGATVMNQNVNQSTDDQLNRLLNFNLSH